MNTSGNGSGWGEYQRLVLAELERHNGLILDLGKHLNAIVLELALLQKEGVSTLDMERRLKKLEDQDIASEAVSKYKKWIVATALLLATSIIIPIVKLLFFPGA